MIRKFVGSHNSHLALSVKTRSDSLLLQLAGEISRTYQLVLGWPNLEKKAELARGNFDVLVFVVVIFLC